MEILITSKTHKGQSACVGGLIIKENRFVRLLNYGNTDQKSDTVLNIGDIWEIDFIDRINIIPPHIEDIIVNNKKFVGKVVNLTKFIKNNNVFVSYGHPNKLFNSLLHWTSNGSGYVEDKSKLPNNSVGFWKSDQNLIYERNYYYYKEGDKIKRFRFVGFQKEISIIPAGTLIRVSLARWWKPNDSEVVDRCYLQLSGWYDVYKSKT